ncbi:MAG: group II intron maturase-specific domain-containing protein [Agriterribacter sp.]
MKECYQIKDPQELTDYLKEQGRDAFYDWDYQLQTNYGFVHKLKNGQVAFFDNHFNQKAILFDTEKKLKLKVNRTKSKVSQPQDSTLLGFSFYRNKEGWQIRIAPKSMYKIKQKMKGQTKRNDPKPVKEKVKKMDAVIRGWVNYFSIAKAKSRMKEIDELVRTRLRMGIWKQWKKPSTRKWNLEKLGIVKGKAYEWSNSRKGYCRIAHSPILCRALNNEYFKRQRYVGFSNYYYWKTELQQKLF